MKCQSEKLLSCPNRTMIAKLVLRILTLIVVKVCWIVYIPFSVINLFSKRRVCSPISNDILLLPAFALAEKIRNKEISSESVVQAYIDRIEEVNPLLNAVIEDRFKDALEDAKYVEEILNSNTSMKELEMKYPLLGVPITIKGSLAVEGLNHSCGVLLKNKRAIEDAEVVARVKSLGAIPLLVSNTPEFCLNWETHNKLIGATNNPFDSRKTCGGSSGGEGALMSAGASIIGIGSDIAGSLRIPMHFCGVWGHKPSPRLISIEGHYPSCSEAIWPEIFHVGPISRYASDLSKLFEFLVEPKAVSNLKIPINLKKLKVYYLYGFENSLVQETNSDTRRAISLVVNHLRNYTESSVCEEMNKDILKYATELAYFSLLLVDNIENLFEGRGEGAHFEMIKFLFGQSKSVFTSITYGILRWWLAIIPQKYKDEVEENVKILRNKLLEILDDQSVLILPIVPTDAIYHGEICKRIFNQGYCAIFNTIGFPSTSCPVLRTDEGMPIGVQVVGAPYCDRLCLSVAQEIENAFGGWRQFSSCEQKTSDR